jgi:hypothetical protein
MLLLLLLLLLAACVYCTTSLTVVVHPHALEQQVLSEATQLDVVDALQVLGGTG